MYEIEQRAQKYWTKKLLIIWPRETWSANKIHPNRSHGKICKKRKKENHQKEDSPVVSIELNRSILFLDLKIFLWQLKCASWNFKVIYFELWTADDPPRYIRASGADSRVWIWLCGPADRNYDVCKFIAIVVLEQRK